MPIRPVQSNNLTTQSQSVRSEEYVNFSQSNKFTSSFTWLSPVFASSTAWFTVANIASSRRIGRRGRRGSSRGGWWSGNRTIDSNARATLPIFPCPVTCTSRLHVVTIALRGMFSAIVGCSRSSCSRRLCRLCCRLCCGKTCSWCSCWQRHGKRHRRIRGRVCFPCHVY